MRMRGWLIRNQPRRAAPACEQGEERRRGRAARTAASTVTSAPGKSGAGGDVHGYGDVGEERPRRRPGIAARAAASTAAPAMGKSGATQRCGRRRMRWR
uniref:Uncharacterized protein n=1 Tax=Oryza sativa subsp. japonica TaxID=39947 RepID=Q6EUD6_ORYSJ|nr:hypothetical protein [Oryza sativa Japonica Group]